MSEFPTLPADAFGIYRGDSWGHTIVVATNTDGTPFDLTGYEVRSQMRRHFGAPAGEDPVEVDVAIDDDPTTGGIAVNLLPEQTAAIDLTIKRLAWDVELSNDGLIWTPLRRWVPVSGDVTQEDSP